MATARPWIERGIFIYGPRKSGSTLVQCLLDGAPDLFVFPGEIGISQGRVDPGRVWKLPRSHAELIPELETFSLTVEPSSSVVPQVQRGIVDLYDLCRSNCGSPTRWAIKDVGGDPAVGVSALARSVRELRILMLLRDPKMVSRAVYTNRRRKGLRLSFRETLIEAVDPLIVLSRQWEFAGDPRVTWLVYEDLVAAPRAAMEKVVLSLGISPWDGMTEPTVLGRPVIVATASERRTGIFKADHEWWHGLTRKEVAVVLGASVVFPLAYRVRTGRRPVTYRRVKAALPTGAGQAGNVGSTRRAGRDLRVRGVRHLRWSWRRRTSGSRVLPDFVIIGAQRSGTSSVYASLAAHPQVVPAARKEVHYFDLHYDEGIAWYRAHFPLRRQLRGDRITGEATPYLLFHPDAPPRVAVDLPDVRLIAILRDPVERALSQYRYSVKRGYESLAVADALAAEPARLDTGDPFSHQHHSYRSRGLYAQQLERWMEVVGSERLLVVQSEALFRDGLEPVTDFLNLSPISARLPVENPTATRAAPAEVVAELRRFFQPHNEELEKLIGRKMPWPFEPGRSGSDGNGATG